MLASLESFLHRLRRRLSRNEWAIRHLGLAPSEDTGEEPGLLLIQIDGLSRHQLEASMASGRMPFLRRLHERGQYSLHTFYSGLPSTTPAVQAELYYGVRAAVPAFHFLNRARGETGMMFDPEWAKEFEARFAAQAEGLLEGGSSWCNIYSGGAVVEESNFCVACMGLGDMWRAGKFGNNLLFILLQLPAALRIAGRMLIELVVGLPEAMRGIFRGQWASQELGMVLSRMCVGIGIREIISIGAKIDVTRGLPIVHINFLGYDERAHRRGPGSRFAHWSLNGIDRAIRDLYREAHRSRRRDYHVWIFSDHGQERTESFAMKAPGGIERIVSDCLEADETPAGPAGRPPKKSRPPVPWSIHAHRHGGQERAGPETGTVKPFTITALGPVAHLYFAEPMDDDRKRSLARRLVAKGGVPGVLHRTVDGTITWFHADGGTAVPDGVAARLETTHPKPLRNEIARDFVAFCENENAGDLILLGWSPNPPLWSFAPERGAHAGPGPEETQGFLLVPAATHLPAGAGHFVRPGGLRSAALHLLGREPLDAPRIAPRHPARLRVMSYNVHSCIGMDGRISPRRIARVIAQQSPDLVALQELDHGRIRSRGEDQATAIAEHLGYHVVFCPTISQGNEHYGHAVLSRWPVETLKIAELPGDPRSWWIEPRSALWSRVAVGDMAINVVTTHLGLSARERLAQMRALLGADWLEPILDSEPVILCGDFNLAPGSAPYQLARACLHDVAPAGGKPLHTFSSMHPFVRIDHIFVSAHFAAERAIVVRNDLTRVASDHLPLLAELHFKNDEFRMTADKE